MMLSDLLFSHLRIEISPSFFFSSGNTRTFPHSPIVFLFLFFLERISSPPALFQAAKAGEICMLIEVPMEYVQGNGSYVPFRSLGRQDDQSRFSFKETGCCICGRHTPRWRLATMFSTARVCLIHNKLVHLLKLN